MSALYILLLKLWLFAQALVAVCWASSLSPEHAAQEFSGRLLPSLLGAPDAEKLLNSVLGKIQHSRQLARQRARQVECEEILPEYTESIEGGRARDLSELGGQKHFPICNLQRKIRRLNTNEYEYRPAFYEEVLCVPSGAGDGVGNEVCSGLGLSCVQWNKTIHLTRRRYTSDCWETRTLVIPAGCECLWPAHKLGDMSLHI